MQFRLNFATVIQASTVGAAVYGFAAAIVAHAGLWEAADTWESLGIATVATAASLLQEFSGWLNRDNIQG